MKRKKVTFTVKGKGRFMKKEIPQESLKEFFKRLKKNRKECLKRHKGNELAIQFDKGELFMLECISERIFGKKTVKK